jgi:glycerophosphoryl diester phosphodiesterase
MSVNAWTVNKEKDMEKMLQMGVDQLTTDNPLEAREVMKKIKIAELK